MITLTTFADRHLAVFGLARSGIVAAEALIAGGATVSCWDDSDAGRAAAAKAGLSLVDLKTADWSQFSSLVLAPGVPLTHPKPHWVVERATVAGVEIIGDIELFFRERASIAPGSPVIAITGTNGKSTTTALTAHVLEALGHDVQMGGNIGVGVLSLAPPAPNRIHVLELSSFQIDTTPTLNPSIGILLNITPDHLDRHGTLDHYAAVKERLVTGADVAIVGEDDDRCRAIAARRRARDGKVIGISVDHDTDVFYRNGRIHQRIQNRGATDIATALELSGIGSLRGAHNGQNAAAAFAATFIHAPRPPRDIATAFASFPGLVHRMEELGHVGKTLIINDSKATNADSTEKALASFDRDIFWIAGGTPKEGGITPLQPYFDRVRKAYLVGQCAPDFAVTLDGKIAYELCHTLDVAIAAATRDAAASNATAPVVLLSPACASYDQYKSFEHRGDHFRQLATALPGFLSKGRAS